MGLYLEFMYLTHFKKLLQYHCFPILLTKSRLIEDSYLEDTIMYSAHYPFVAHYSSNVTFHVRIKILACTGDVFSLQYIIYGTAELFSSS